MRGEYTKATKGKWKIRANELAIEADEAARVAVENRQLAEELQVRLDLATAEAQKKQDALDEVERQREMERATGQGPQPPAVGADEGGGAVDGGADAAGAPQTGSAGAVVYSGQAEGLSPDVHGAGWLVEARDRQARQEALESKTTHFKERCVALSLARRRERMLYAVWRGWSGLVEGTRRRQGEKLTSMAGKMLAAAASSPDGGRLLLAPDGTHDPRHDEWWMRGSPKKHLARSPAVDVRAMV